MFKMEVYACCTPLVSLDVSRDTANYKIYTCGRLLFKRGMKNKKERKKKDKEQSGYIQG
jgi:hypothetical protein